MAALSHFLVGDAFSIADIALLAYTRLAPEAGYDLTSRPNLTRWIAACEAELGLQPLANPASAGAAPQLQG